MKALRTLLLMTLLLVPGGVAVAQAVQDGVLIDQAEMTQILEDYLAEQSQLLPQVELRFASVDLPEPFTVPHGRIDHQIMPARPGVVGSRRITLLTRVDDQVVNNQSMRVELEALAEVAVAKEVLRRGTVLKPEHLEMRYQDISRLSDPVFSIEAAVGQLVKRSLRLGEPLQAQYVEVPAMIKRGERVVIEVNGSGLTLSAVGEARQDGRQGESIRVVNSSSSREVLTRVVAPGLVRVEL